MTINAIPGSNDRTAHPKRTISLSLRNRLLITFILLSALPVLVTGIVSGLINAQGLRSAALDQLTSVAQLKTTEIVSWISSLQANLNLISQGQGNLDNTKAILQNSAKADTAKTDLRNALNSSNTITGYFEELFILDKNGTVVLSTNSSQEGKIFLTQSFYLEGSKDAYVSPPVYDISLSKYTIIFSQPVKDESGGIIGVIAGRANLAVLNQIMVERAGLGQTGETYLVGANYALLSQLRFGDAKIGETYIRTNGTTNAIKSKLTGSELYNDYRATPVLGSYLWIPKLQVALVAEHDQSEALQPSNQAFAITLGLMALTVAIALGVAFLVTRSIVNPISQLVTIAENISSGNFEVNAKVQRTDEIGVLAKAFNTMTNRLRELIGTLEQRVADRTKALATSSEVSRRLSTILDQKELVAEVVSQVNNAFGYYHTQIYFYDESSDNLVMAGGTGSAGEMMLAQFHKVAKGRGLVGRAAENNQAVLVSDTLQNSEWLPNVLLPDTKSEVAIPISIGDTVLGVLDVQHNITDGLQQDDVDTLQSVANQVAIALQNALQYDQAQSALTQSEKLFEASRRLTQAADLQELVKTTVETLNISVVNRAILGAFSYNAAGELESMTDIANWWNGTGSEVAAIGTSYSAKALELLSVFLSDTPLFFNDTFSDERMGVVGLQVAKSLNIRAGAVLPLLLGTRQLGILMLQAEAPHTFTQDEVRLFSALAPQIATVLENRRQYERAQHQSERETAVNIITQKIQNTTSIEAALQIAARELGHALGMKSTLVSLDPSALADQQNLPKETELTETGVSK